MRLRTWRTINDFAIGPGVVGPDGRAEARHEAAPAQAEIQSGDDGCLSLAAVRPLRVSGVKKKAGVLWYGWRYPVDGDTPGRAAFHGAKVFENPDFAGKTTYEEMTKAGVALASGIIDTAHELGMSAAFALSPLEFPKEFSAVLPKAKVIHQLESLTVGPGPQQPPDDPTIKGLVRAQLRAFIDTYPKVDALYLTLPEFPDWVEHHEKAWQKLDAHRRRQGDRSEEADRDGPHAQTHRLR